MTADLETFPEEFEHLARDLVTFLHFLHDIPELRDESLNASVLRFEGDLKYRASCLREFEGQFGLSAIKRYVNDLTREMDEHMEAIRDALKLFVVEGVTTIRTAQNHAQNWQQNFSTVAILLGCHGHDYPVYLRQNRVAPSAGCQCLLDYLTCLQYRVFYQLPVGLSL